jgi:hypothetical protein
VLVSVPFRSKYSLKLFTVGAVHNFYGALANNTKLFGLVQKIITYAIGSRCTVVKALRIFIKI